jgi:NAD(P)H-nitrite reductase large subunit
MHIAIVGNGISGITAARHLRKKSNAKITVISSESKYFYSRTALMYIYMGHMKLKNTQPYEPDFWQINKIDLKYAHVNQIDFEANTLHFDTGEIMGYDSLILAVGSTSNRFGWPGQDLDGVGSLYSLQDLEEMEKFSKNLNRAVIVGGGLIGVEMAEMFHSRKIPVTFLVREKSYWNNVLPPEESEIVNQEILDHHIDLQLETELKEIMDNGRGSVSGVRTSKEKKINCGFVGLTAGVHPNVAFLRNSKLEIDKGILVNEHLETNVKDVYAIGDCAQLRNPEQGRRAIEAIWYTGRMMGELVAHNIMRNESKLTYKPGIWFNSAKFFNIEYQVYGDIPSIRTEGQESLLWISDSRKKSIRINYSKKTGEVLGFNLLGIRFRHQVCEKWIYEKTNIESVLQNLELAAFDPEFYPTYEHALRQQFKNITGKRISAPTHRKLNQVLKFLYS